MRARDYFDQVAPHWDEMRKSLFSEAVRDKALRIADVRKGRIAADIGTGTGFITEGLIRREVKVIAVDRSKMMLTEMRKKLRSSREIEYCVGDAENLPITDKAVDYVFSNMCLHHLDFPLKAIKEMTRILKPEGKLVVTDMDKHDFEFLKIEHHDRWMGFEREDIKRWLKEAGLKNINVECANETCCAQSSCGENAEISIFLASGERGKH